MRLPKNSRFRKQYNSRIIAALLMMFESNNNNTRKMCKKLVRKYLV